MKKNDTLTKEYMRANPNYKEISPHTFRRTASVLFNIRVDFLEDNEAKISLESTISGFEDKLRGNKIKDLDNVEKFFKIKSK